MKIGVYSNTLISSLADAGRDWLYEPEDLGWSLDVSVPGGDKRLSVVSRSIDEIIN